MSGVLVKLISLMLLFPRWGLSEVQPLTSCYSFVTASVQLLKFNSICHLRRGLGKSHHHKNFFFQVGSVKSKRKTILSQTPLCKTEWKMWALAPLLLWGKGEKVWRNTHTHTHTHTHTLSFRCSWKNEVRFRRPGSKENRFLKLLWGTLSSVLRAD